jgi:arylsulfatase
MDFAYDGGGVARGGTVTLSVDGRPVGQSRVDRTIPYYFSFDETLDVGVDLGTPTSEDYAGTDTVFTATIRAVHVAVGDDVAVADEGARERRVLTSQ